MKDESRFLFGIWEDIGESKELVELIVVLVDSGFNLLKGRVVKFAALILIMEFRLNGLIGEEGLFDGRLIIAVSEIEGD